MTTIVLSVIGIISAVVVIVRLWPELRPVTVSLPPPRSRGTKQTVTIGGRDVEVDVPAAIESEAAPAPTETTTVAPSAQERIWFYSMIGIAIFVGLFSLATSVLWLFFLARNQGDPPAALSEMLKYLVTSLVGIFVGFMGGSSVSAARQANVQKQISAKRGE